MGGQKSGLAGVAFAGGAAVSRAGQNIVCTGDIRKVFPLCGTVRGASSVQGVQRNVDKWYRRAVVVCRSWVEGRLAAWSPALVSALML